MTCTICGKTLTDLTSVKLGIGPICRAKYGITGSNGQGELMFNNHADFALAKETDQFVYIIDRGNHSQSKTVTNDVEWVLSELNDLIEGFDKKRLFYMDSEGRIDEILHTGKTFNDFKAGYAGVTL
jgi:hypothetical protein